MLDFRQSFFFLELLAAAPIFCSNMKPGSRSPLTGLLVILSSFLLSSLSVFYRFQSYGFAGKIMWVGYYLLIFCLMAAVVLCYRKATVMELLVVAVLSYSAQHLGYNIWMLIAIGTHLPLSIETVFSAPYLLLQAACYLAVYLTLYFTVGRQFEIDSTKIRNRRQWLLSCFSLLFIAIAFNLFFIPADGDARFSLFFIDSICTLFGIVTICLITKRDALENDLALMGQIWRLRQEHYEITKESMDIINVKCHDMQKAISSLYVNRAGPMDQDTLDEIRNSIRIYDAVFHTGNEALDVLLTEKSFLCRNDDIRFTCAVDGGAVDFMSTADIYALFGNILDNAIEAVRLLPREEDSRRVIDCTIRAKNSFLVIQEQNYYDGVLKIKNGFPVTCKQDTNYHGFGMKSIQLVVDKYGGNLSFSANENIFVLDILIPIEKRESDSERKC